MKRLSCVLVLSLVLMAPCVRSAEAAPFTYAFSAGPTVWTYPICPPPDWGSGWCIEDPSSRPFGVEGTFTMEGDVLVDFDGHPPGWDYPYFSQVETSSRGVSIVFWAHDFGFMPAYEYQLIYEGIPSAGETVPLLRSEVLYYEPEEHWGYFTSGELRLISEAVPEPASLLLFGTGLVALRAWRKRR